MIPLPIEAVEDVLRSIFADERLHSNAHKIEESPPFVSPFGASVLMCGRKGCGINFYDPEDTRSLEPNAVHRRRTEHFKQTYGLGSDFSNSPHGLPENTLAPKPPTSTHYNIHSSIARVWSALPRTTEPDPGPIVSQTPTPSKLTKELVWAGSEDATTAFISAVRFEICAKNKRGNIYQTGIEDNVR